MAHDKVDKTICISHAYAYLKSAGGKPVTLSDNAVAQATAWMRLAELCDDQEYFVDYSV